MPVSRRKGHKKSSPALITILLVMVIGGGFFGIHLWDQSRQRLEAAELSALDDEFPGRMTVTYQGETYVLRDDLKRYLLIGVDKLSDVETDPEAYVNSQQADFLLLMVLDRSSKSIFALHINRDTMAEIQRIGLNGQKLETFKGQMALAHTYGSGGRDSCRLTTQAVSAFLYGIPVEHFFSVTMDAIPVLNDLAGGVTVHIDDDFSSTDASLVQGTDVTLKGRQALTFVRARSSMADSSNLRRMNRQREYMYGLLSQLMQKLREEDGFAARLASKLSDYSVSDLTTDDLSALAEQLKDYRFTTIYQIEGEAVKGEQFTEFYADDAALQEQVIRLFFESCGQDG